MKATVPRKGDWPGRTYTIPSRPGSTYPSVTSIIGRGDQYPQRWEQYPLATKRGQIVHQRIAMHLAHSRRARNEPFDGVSLEQFEEAAPYVQAAINFIADHVKEIVYVEQNGLQRHSRIRRHRGPHLPPETTTTIVSLSSTGRPAVSAPPTPCSSPPTPTQNGHTALIAGQSVFPHPM